jgi:Spy/CpxP family protein refolding chaperone
MRRLTTLAALCALTFSLTALFAPIAEAQRGESRPRQGQRDGFRRPPETGNSIIAILIGLLNTPKVQTQLKMTPDQIKQAEGLKPYVAKMKDIRQDKTLTPEQKREKLRAISTEAREKIKAILTPEQQKQLMQIVREMRQRGKPGK